MMDFEFYEELLKIFKEEAVLKEEPMKEHTSFRIGGPAEFFVKLSAKEEVGALSSLCAKKDKPLFIIGKGSNLLVKDEGIRGVVAAFSEGLALARREGNEVIAGAGMTLSSLADFTAKEGLSGLEFASGIPGTVGGAIFMNAGAYGGEMKDVLVSAEVYVDGEIKTFSREELNLAYRKSLIQELSGAIVLTASFLLIPDDEEEIRARIEDLNERRREKQPLELPSAGSTFKRPENGYASKLIDEAGLRGTRIGGAEVSKKHTGFIVNVDEASCEDVKKLITHIQETVYDKSGIRLTPEVRML